MKSIFSVTLAVSLLGSAVAVAQPGGYPGRDDQGRHGQDRSGQDRYEGYRNNPGVRMSSPQFSRGDRLPDLYRRNRQYVVADWRKSPQKAPAWLSLGS